MTTLGFKITADATQAERAVAAFSKKSSAYIGSIGTELKGQLAGAFAAGAVIAAVRSLGAHVVETVDNVKDLSEQLSISTDDVQRLQKAANDAGVGFSEISVAMQRIEALRAQAAGGDKNAQGIFSALGIDPSQGTGLNILTKAIDAGTVGGKTAAMFNLLGNKASLLKNVMAELKAQGPIDLINENSIEKIDQANLRLQESKRRLTALSTPLATAALEGTTGTIQDLIGGGGGLNFGGPLRFLSSLMSSNKLAPMAADAFVGPMQGAQSSRSASVSTATTAAAVNLSSSSDALSRIGLFVGGRPEARRLTDIASNTAATARHLERQTKIFTSIEDLLKDSL